MLSNLIPSLSIITLMSTLPAPVCHLLHRIPVDVLWCVLDFLEDSDLRPLAAMPEFRQLVTSSAFVAPRCALARRRIVRFFEGAADAGAHRTTAVRRLSLSALVRSNRILGGSVSLRLHDEGAYVLGPEHLRQCATAQRLARFFVRKALGKRLNRRPPLDELVARNVFPQMRPLTSALIASAVSLQRAHLRAQLGKRLAARPSFESLKQRGLLPVYAITSPCSSYLSLLPQQVMLSNHFTRGRIAAKIARRPLPAQDSQPQRRASIDFAKLVGIPYLARTLSFDFDRLLEDLDVFLRDRESPSALGARKLLPDTVLAGLLCHGVQDKIRFYEGLDADHSQC